MSARGAEGATMRKDIEFKTEDGIELRGSHYLPEKRTGKVPTIVMAHGFSAVKEMYLDRFADAFAAAGLGALVFDNRNFGASGGKLRQEIDPWQQSTATIETPSRLPKRCLKRTSAHRYLGLKLQRWSCDGDRGNRSTGQMCRRASPTCQRSRQCTSPHSS